MYYRLRKKRFRQIIALPLLALLLCLFSCSKETVTETVKENEEQQVDTDGDTSQETEEAIWSVNRDGQNALNVIFLKPSDYTLQDETVGEISNMMLYIQKWVEKQMILNGYDKTFGLVTNQNGVVRVDVLQDNRTASYYFDKETQDPYSTLPELNAKVSDYFLANPDAKKSEHTLILSIEETLIRFVGTGKNAYARSTDFSMTPTGKFIDNLELMNSDRLGGIIHELGHGLNVPHNCHKNSDVPNVALMSYGNQTYENGQEEAVFMTPTTAAILNVNEAFNKPDDGVAYYTQNELTLVELNVTKNDNEQQIQVEGRLSSDKEITSVYVGNDGGVSGTANTNYDDITFVSALNNLENGVYGFTVEIPYSELFNGYKDDEKDTMLFSINAISRNGNRERIFTYAYTIDLTTKLPNDDVMRNFQVFELSDRSTWSVSTNSTSPNTSRGVENIIDGDSGSYWHSNYPYNIATDGPHEIDIDMQSQRNLSGIYLQSNRSGTNFRPSHVVVLISIDGLNYTEAQQFDVDDVSEVQLLFNTVQSASHIKIQVDAVHVANGGEENLILNEVDIILN